MADVTIDNIGKVMVLTINKPEKRNAISLGVSVALQEGFRAFDASDARVAIITGSGTAAFSSGADLNDMPDVGRCLPTIGTRTDKPIICAVEGWCIGVGLMVVGLSDLCVAGRSARFSYPEGRVGLTMGVGPALAKRLPHKIAMELLLTGDTVTAERAFSFGFVNRLCEDGKALATALEMAERIAGMAPLVVQTIKSTVNDDILTPTPSEVMFRRQAQIEMMQKSRDHVEGIAAFNERRPPRFTGQ